MLNHQYISSLAVHWLEITVPSKTLEILAPFFATKSMLKCFVFRQKLSIISPEIGVKKS